jgi:hypothetical protein
MKESEFLAEYDRLWNWRSLWTRLSNRPAKNFLATLQVRDERIQRKAKLADAKIRSLGEVWRKNMQKEIDFICHDCQKPVYKIPKGYYSSGHICEPDKELVEEVKTVRIIHTKVILSRWETPQIDKMLVAKSDV